MQDELIQEAEVMQEADVETVQTEDIEIDTQQATANTYKKGDWTLKCKCGETTVIYPAVEHALQVIVPVDSPIPWKLVCPSCKNEFELYYTNVTEHEYPNETSQAEESDSGVLTSTENVDEPVEQTI